MNTSNNSNPWENISWEITIADCDMKFLGDQGFKNANDYETHINYTKKEKTKESI